MSISHAQVTQQLQALARQLLEAGQIGVVIGYGEAGIDGAARPIFVTSAAQAHQLRWGPDCLINLAVYLTRADVRALGRPAVVLKGCDARAVAVLLAENQLDREDLVLLGVGCEGVEVGGAAAPKCHACQVRTPSLYDHLLGGEPEAAGGQPDFSGVDRLEAMDLQQRWDFWQGELSRCLKCYACRAACPLCCCDGCFTDQTRPAWTNNSQSAKDIFHFHLFRALHLAGRCVCCGECGRACPQGIPLGLLNMKLAREVRQRWGTVPGMDAEERTPLLAFDPDDPEDFIR